MKITSFAFDDYHRRWRLERASFDAFNLLVGVSGVGKTRILEALRRVCRAAIETEANPGHARWTLELEHEGQSYVWEARTEPVQSGGFAEGTALSEASALSEQPVQFTYEKVVRNRTETLIERNYDRFTFQGRDLPKLTRSGSAVALLDEEASAPIGRGLRRILFSEPTARREGFFFSFSAIEQNDKLIKKLQDIKPLHFSTFKEAMSLNNQYNGLLNLSKALEPNAYLLQEVFPSEFNRVKDTFIDIFPSVTDLRVALTSKPGTTSGQVLELTIEEEGTDGWISQDDLSSGMLRTLIHLFEIAIMPPGSTLVVDEFENSLGINCMPSVTRHLFTRPDCQFLLTSHHPYIINNIPVDAWKLVKRKGGVVQVVSARDIPALKSASHHEAFIQLINLPDFEDGIS